MKGGLVPGLHLLLGILTCFPAASRSDDPYRFFTWVVTYGIIAPLGTEQQVILINGRFPGPSLDCVTNDNIVLNLVNNLDEPFLITWNGIKQRKNSWQDGVLGTNCPIPPGGNYTYKFQPKDQIGTFTYFPSTAMHRAAGGFGALNVHDRSVIPVPYPTPAGEFTILVGDWYTTNHKTLQQDLNAGSPLPSPDGLLMNGSPRSSSFAGAQGKTYLFRVSNVGLQASINFRIQGHKLQLVEVEGSHVVQNIYDSIDVHVGQSIAVLVLLNQPPQSYYVVASTQFSSSALTASGILSYGDSKSVPSGQLPPPTLDLNTSMQQASSFRWNLSANAARPNPQGSFHYGKIPTSRSLLLASSAPELNEKQRYAINGVSFVVPDTPLKLADNFNIPGIYTVNSIPDHPNGVAVSLATSVVQFDLHEFVEIVFQNTENNTMQAWHLDGYDFWVVGYGLGAWTPESRSGYNLVDALTRYTVQVYPSGWSAILVSLDNEGMWNIRSAMWARQYLGQQFYMRVWSPNPSLANEYNIPSNALLCGQAKGLHT